MIMSMKRTFVFILLFSFPTIHTTRVVNGDVDDGTKTFSFPVAQFLSNLGGRIFVSADAPGGKEYSISFLRTFQEFAPLAFESVLLNNQEAQNPLFDSRIQFLTSFENDNRGLAAVRDASETAVYIMHAVNPRIVYCAEPLTDAAGNPAASIAGLEGSTIERAYVAVTPQGGVFGDDNTGINVAGLVQVTTGSGEKTTTTTQAAFRSKAVSFDKNTTAFFVGSPLTLFNAPPHMHWDAQVSRLYASAGTIQASGNTGSRAISVGFGISGIHVTDFILRSILVDDFDFSGITSSHIIATPENGILSVHHLDSMCTSANASYVILVGGNGTPEQTASSVFAIPVVRSARRNIGTMRQENSFKGFIANKDNLDMPALNASELVTSDDVAAQIGGGPLAAGSISDLSVRLDVVYVTVNEGETPGIYQSQALFNAQGVITGWTRWERASNVNQNIRAFSQELLTGSVFLLTSDDPNGTNEPNTVLRTQWGEGDAEQLGVLTSTVQQSLNESNGGIQGFMSFSDATPGLDVTLLTSLGHNAVVLAQTGTRVNNIPVPTAGSAYEQQLTFDTGVITQTPTDQTILSFTGGVLETIASAITATIVHSDIVADSWLFVGGTGGVAVLRTEEGAGWGNTLGQNFAGVTEGMEFMLFNHYSFVKKLVSDGGFLYVLTDMFCDRIDLRNGLLQATVTRIADVRSFRVLDRNGVFTDIVVSGPLALLGTSNGLLSITPGSSVQAISPSWQLVEIPEATNPVVQLLPLTTTGVPGDLVKTSGGNLIVLTGNASTNLSFINRYAITPIMGEIVESNTILPLSTDEYVIGVPSYLIDYGRFQDAYGTDGALVLAARNVYRNEPAFVNIPWIGRLPRSGTMFVGVTTLPIIDLVPLQASIAALFKEKGSGSWMVGGSMGIRVND